MYQHFVLLSSSYQTGTRVGLDFVEGSLYPPALLDDVIFKIKKICKEDLPLSVHMVSTDGIISGSVAKKDGYFEDVVWLKDSDELIRKVMADRAFDGLAVARYILSMQTCQHLKLQKLVYLCYEDYLRETDQSLFADKIYAFQLGPVVNSVYEQYRKYGEQEISLAKRDFEAAAASRILFAEDGPAKKKSIDRTLARYQDLTPAQLVDLTHRPGSPWERCYDGKRFTEIDDASIKGTVTVM